MHTDNLVRAGNLVRDQPLCISFVKAYCSKVLLLLNAIQGHAV